MCLAADGYQAPLPGEAEQEQVAGDGVAEQFGGDAGGVDEVAAVLADFLADGLLHLGGEELGVRIEHEGGVRQFRAVHHGAGAAGVDLGQGASKPEATARSQPSIRSASPAGDAHGLDVVLLGSPREHG